MKFTTTATTKEYFVFGNGRIARVTSITGTRIYPTEATFFLYDHLGNTRVAFQYSTANVNFPHTVVNAMDYYPYGKMLREYDNGDGDKYLTTNHERDKETGLDYRGARYYDSDVARFLSLDPMASKYPSLSAYNYVAGNPIMFVDPDGRDIIKSAAFLATGFNDRYEDLKKNNAAFKKHFGLFEKNNKLNINLGIDDAGLDPDDWALTSWEYSFDVNSKGANYLTDLNVDINFRVDVEALESLSDLGMVALTVHELLHSYEGLNMLGGDETNDGWGNYLSKMVEIMTEYSKDEEWGLTTDQIYEVSIYNIGKGGTLFDDHIISLAQKNKTTVQEERELYYERMNSLVRFIPTESEE